MTDKELIIGIKNNSKSVWRSIYFEMKPKIERSISHLLSNVKDLTFDDIYSEGLITLMENVKDGKLDENADNNLSGYLYTICYRIAYKQTTRKKPADDGNGSIAESTFTFVDPDVISSDEEYARNFLDRVLSSLPLNCRQIFKRFYWDKLPLDKIAVTMGLKNANSAKTTKSRCMSKYKELAQKLFADDEKAEQAVRRSVERDALRNILERFRLEDRGEIKTAACKNSKDKDSQE